MTPEERRLGVVALGPTVTRFEVIDYRSVRSPTGELQPYSVARNGERGRVFAAHGVNIEVSFQDAGRTLKVFVNDGEALYGVTLVPE
jgi:hypothetical protein